MQRWERPCERCNQAPALPRRRREGQEGSCTLTPFRKAPQLTGNLQQFTKEVYVWSKLSHPNVLPLLGFAICEETRFPLLISEWMYLGTAWTYVQTNQDLSLAEVAELVC